MNEIAPIIKLQLIRRDRSTGQKLLRQRVYWWILAVCCSLSIWFLLIRATLRFVDLLQAAHVPLMMRRAIDG